MNQGKFSIALILCLVIAGQIFSLQPGKKYNFRFKDGQHLRNAILLEETETAYKVRLDYIAEEKILEKKDLTELPLLAHSLLLSPATTVPLARLETISITFAEPTLGADEPENYRLSGQALGTLKIAGIRRTGAFTYELQLSGQPADGDLVIKLQHITDNVGAPLITDSIEYKLDATKPRVDAAPLNKSAVRALDTLQLQFSEEVFGAGKRANYELSGSGLGSLRLAAVTQDTAAGNNYRLVFKGKSGNGEIRLRLRNIADRAGNPLESAEITYTADTLSPTVAVFPAPNVLLSELHSIELIFSEAVTGADNRENIVISGTGAGNLRVREIVRGEDGRYRVHLAGTAANGSVEISLANVGDLAGNLLRGNTFTYRTDVQPPELRALPAPGTALSRLSAVEIDFSEPVYGAGDPRNYVLQGDGAGDLALQKIRRINAARYALAFAGTPGNGRIVLRLKNIADAAGNPLRIDTLEYPADITPPRYTASLLPGSYVNAINEIDLEFSEPVVGAEKRENYAISGEGAEQLLIAAVTPLKEHSYRITFSGVVRNGKIALKLQNIADVAGNPLAAGILEYLTDTTPPELQKISPAAGATLRELREIELQFSEPVTGADNTQNYLLSGEALGSLRITSATRLPGNRVRLALAGLGGEGRISLRWQGISDRAKNAPARQGVDFRLDSRSPVFQTDLPSGIVIAEVKTITLRYSEVVTGAENAKNYRLLGPGAGTLSVRSVTVEKSGNYVIRFAGIPDNGDVTLSIINVSDVAGNPLQGNSLTFRADVTPPAFTFSPSEKMPLSRLDEILLQFSEPVTGADRVENYRLAGEGVGNLKISAAEALSESQYRISFTGKPGNGKIAVLLGNVTDAAGNKAQKETLAYQADTIPPSFEATPRSGSLANAFSRIDISYSKPVSGGGEAKSYILSGNGIGDLRIDRVLPLNATQYRLVLTGTPQSGTIQLTLSGIADLAGNALLQNPVVYQGDTVRPTVTAEPPPGTPLNQLPEITLRFSKPVSGAGDKANYRLTGGGVGSLRLEKIVAANANDYQLVFSGRAAHGDITVVMDNISDGAGNTPEMASLHYRADLKPVEVLALPAHNSKVASLPEIELKFSKEAVGAEELGNYFVTGENTESLKLTTIENRGKNTFLLRFSGEGSGHIRILLKNVKDPAGNELRNNHLDYVIEIPTASQPCGDVVR